MAGMLARIKTYLPSFGPWTSRPGPIGPGPIGYTDEGMIPFSWGWNHGQRGYDPAAGGTNATVFSCVSLYARTIAQLPGYHRKSLDNGGTETIKTSALSRILKRPNEYQTRSDFLYNLVSSFLFEGNGYALALRNEREEVSSLHLLNPRGVHPIVAEDGSVFYSVGSTNPLIDYLRDTNWNDATRWVIPQRDILHVRAFTPRNPLIGESPITQAALPIMTNITAGSNLSTLFTNMSRPSGVIYTDQILTAAQVTELRARWNEQAKGLNAGGTPILTAGLKWQAVTMSAVDAQLLEALKYSSEQIAAVFGIPLALINVMSQATFNNVEALVEFWKVQGLQYYVDRIELEYDKMFILDSDRQYTDFDLNTMMRPDFKSRMDGLTKGVQGGIYAPNEARRMEGLPAVPEGDMPRVQQQLVPLDWEPPEPPAPAPPAEPAEDPDKKPEPEGDDPEAAKEFEAALLRRIEGARYERA